MKSVRIALVAAVTALALTPSIASAHWDYSRWGMTPPEVIAASRGKAAAEPLDHGKSIGLDWHLATADTVVEGEAAKAAFYFAGGETLAKVQLSLKDGSGCDRLLAGLLKRHGPKSPSGAYFWIDWTAKNIIEYGDNRKWTGMTCSVTYSPLPG